MTDLPEIERLRAGSWDATLCKATGVPPCECPVPYACENSCSTHDVALVRLTDAERAVRGAVERCQNPLASSTNVVAGNIEQQARNQAVRECVEALREQKCPQPWDADHAPFNLAADHLERTMLGGEDDRTDALRHPAVDVDEPGYDVDDDDPRRDGMVAS
jgi:hypothetical protein